MNIAIKRKSLSRPKPGNRQPVQPGAGSAIGEVRHCGSKPRPSLEAQGRATPRPALTLVEVVASTMIVGMMAVAALNSLGAATKSSQSISRRAVALGLADELMAEIIQKPYCEPGQTSTPIGRESGELSAGPRSTYDDVDDYHGWDKSPPQSREGLPIVNDANWRQKVQVSYVQPANPTLATAGNTDQGAKRIKVTIQFNRQGDWQTLAEQYAIRTNSGG